MRRASLGTIWLKEFVTLNTASVLLPDESGRTYGPSSSTASFLSSRAWQLRQPAARRSRLCIPRPDTAEIAAAQRATSEAVRFLADHPGFPLRAPTDLEAIVDSLELEGRALEALRLLALADYLESIDHSRSRYRETGLGVSLLRRVAEAAASFKSEISDVRPKDHAVRRGRRRRDRCARRHSRTSAQAACAAAKHAGVVFTRP